MEQANLTKWFLTTGAQGLVGDRMCTQVSALWPALFVPAQHVVAEGVNARIFFNVLFILGGGGTARGGQRIQSRCVLSAANPT